MLLLLLFASLIEPGVAVWRVAHPVLQAENASSGVQLLRRAQDAMGGAAKLAAVRDTMHVMEITLEPAAGGYNMKQVSRYVAPDQFRSEQETPFGRIVVYSDGEDGWMTTPQGTTPLPAATLATARGVLFRQPTALMLSDRDSSRSVKAVGTAAVEVSSAEGETYGSSLIRQRDFRYGRFTKPPALAAGALPGSRHSPTGVTSTVCGSHLGRCSSRMGRRYLNSLCPNTGSIPG